MKTLILMRHAKSSWKDPYLKDRDRPLNEIGKKEIPVMSELFVEQELLPEVILSSSAARARQTVEMLVEASGFQGEVQYLDSFYMAECQQYLDAIKALPNKLERVMIVGHNPGLEGLLQILSGQLKSLPTAAIAYISLPIQSWRDLGDGVAGELIGLWQPRDLKKEKK